MRIDRPRLVERAGELAYLVPVSSTSGEDELWLSVDSRFRDLVSDRSEAALLALLAPAMGRGEDIQVEGPVSARCLYNLSGPLQILLRAVIPKLKRVRIRASEVLPPPPPATGVATGFSAGIDSFSVLADHHYGEPPPGYRITHLFYNNVGSHGGVGNPVFRARFDRLRPVAERMELPFVAVDSNLMSFYHGLGFKQTYTVRNAVVALLLQAGIGKSFHAAGTVFGDQPLKPGRDIAFFDPVILAMISTEALDAVSAGGVYTRIEKTLQVAEIEESHDVLDVCVRNDRAGNCSTCKKCVRTLLTLEIAGLLDRYQTVFDIDAYRRGRRWWIARILHGKYRNAREIRDFARERGYRFSIAQWLIAWTRLDILRAWMIGKIGRTRAGGRWVRARNDRRSPLRRART